MTVNATKHCIKCSNEFNPTPRQMRDCAYRCLPCERAYRAVLRGGYTHGPRQDRERIIREKQLPYIATPETGCWLWEGSWTSDGYGRIGSGKRGGMLLAHRLSYQTHVGPIPAGMQVCHQCDTPPCINPGHLFLGTAKDNSDDKWRKGRARPGGRKQAARIAKRTAGAQRVAA